MRGKPLLILLAAVAVITGGLLLGRDSSPTAASATIGNVVPAFHDLRTNPTRQYVDLIDPDHPEIVALAKEFASLDAAYRFVSREIAFAPFAPPGPVEKTLAYRTGSCLGKSALLASIYRAMGMPSEDVRLVMGMVITPQGLAEHVWLDLELQGQCLQQDPSGMLGQFDPGEFPGNRYVETYVMKETFCFNDRDFAVVSQLNRFKNGGTMPGQ